MEPRALADYECNTGEGPLWHPEESCIYWTDIPNGRLFQYDWVTGEHRMIWSGPAVGGMTLQEDGSLALFMEKGAVAILRNGIETVVLPFVHGEEDNRFNDVIADPNGRVFAGTMCTENRKGRLYRIGHDLSVKPVVENVGCSNGMGFSGDRKKMYYIDSEERLVSVFDYDEITGEIENRRDVLRDPNVPGVPDGMTVDDEDCLWVAYWDGYCVVRYDPQGQEMRRVMFPAKKVSCVTFGGPAYEDMFVTTAGGDEKRENGKLAGNLFHLVPGVKGRPEYRSKIGM
ncbi:MAG TPA: SMP-30/gluconolactonase/LRE family protein [Fimbriimonas sp.]